MSRCVRRNDQIINLFEVSYRFFLYVMHIKVKQILVFNFIFDLLWTGRDASVSFVAILGFREVK